MTTIAQHLISLHGPHYCPACGNSKPTDADYCLDCYLQSEDVYLVGEGWEPEPMYPYDILPEYIVGYVSDITNFCP